MNKFFSVCMLSAVLMTTAGCGAKKQTKAAIEQKATVAQNFIQEESNASTDKKEDYIIA